MKRKQTCLVCGKEFDSLLRGLCGRDYGRFRIAKESLPEDQQDDFESLLISKNHLAPSKQGQHSIDDNVFADVLREFNQITNRDSNTEIAKAERLADNSPIEPRSDRMRKERHKPKK